MAIIEKEPVKEDDIDTTSEELQEEIDHLANLKAKIKMKEKDEKTDTFLDTIECLAESIDEMNEIGKEKIVSDQGLNKSLDATIAKLDDYLLTGKAIETVVKQLAKRDGEDALSVTRLVREINKQTQELTQAISKTLDRPTGNGASPDPQIKEILGVIERSNRLVLTNLSVYTAQLERTVQTIGEAVINRPTIWRHEVYLKQNGKLDYILSSVGKEKLLNNR